MLSCRSIALSRSSWLANTFVPFFLWCFVMQQNIHCACGISNSFATKPFIHKSAVSRVRLVLRWCLWSALISFVTFPSVKSLQPMQSCGTLNLVGISSDGPTFLSSSTQQVYLIIAAFSMMLVDCTISRYSKVCSQLGLELAPL